MKNTLRTGLLAVLAFAAAFQASAYHLFTVTSGGSTAVVRWTTFGNVFTADTDGPAAQDFTALCTTATTTWNSIVDAKDVFGTPTTSAVNFTGANINTAWGSLTGDGKFELVYDADGSALVSLGLDPASVNGYGPSRERMVAGAGVIDDAYFIVTGTRANFDLLSTLIHELGHIQGIAHSTVGMSNSSTADTALDKIALNSVPTMHPFSLPTGNTNRRTPEPDDMAALRELYPEDGAAARWASIAGDVKRCGTNAAVTGASVRLVSTTNSNIQITRFTSYDGNADGRYVISYIPAGTYRVIVEPIGVNGFTLNRFGNPPNSAETDFDYEYLSPTATESACTEEMPEAAADRQDVTATNGSTSINNNIRVGAPDLAFVIDDTGSMSEEITAVRTILTNTIATLQAATPARPFPLTAVVTFKDDVTKRIVSNNPASLTAVVNSLFASGGGDCPEAGNAALIVAGRILRKNGVALMFTDADSRSDGPARATVTSLYRSKGIRLNTLMSGTCTGSITPGLTETTDTHLPRGRASAAGEGSSNNDEFSPEPTNGSEPGVSNFSNISSSTGGFFVAIPGINAGSTEEATRYVDTGTNLSVSAVVPALALLTPTSVPQGATLNVQLDGSNTNFVPGNSALVFDGTGITVNSVTVASATRLNANITLVAGATLGFRNASVTTNLGGGITEIANGIGVLNVVTTPGAAAVLSVTPSQAPQGSTTNVVISTSGVTLTAGSTAAFGSGVTVLSNTLIDANTLGVSIEIANGATVGYRRVSVSTPSAPTANDGSPSGAFQVTASAPIVPLIQTLTPNQLAQGATTAITISGTNTNFTNATSVTVSGTGVSVSSLVVNSPTVLVANLTAAGAAPLGFRDVVATTGGESAAILNGLQIVAGSGPAPPPPSSPATPQTITFEAIADHLATDAPFTVTATASSGLPVAFSIVSGPASISGNTITLTGLGVVTVAASQGGSSLIAPALAVRSFNVTLGLPSIDSVQNSASFTPALSPGALAVLFGKNLASGSNSGGGEVLAQTSLTLTDSAGAVFNARLSLATFRQINFFIPETAAPGAALIVVTNSFGKSSPFSINIGKTAPGLFSADSTGAGLAAASILTVGADGAVTSQLSFSCVIIIGCSAQPISVGADSKVYVTLYGTGIRGRSAQSAVTVTLGTVTLPVEYAGAQGLPALDQINVIVPSTLTGAGLIDVYTTVDGVESNKVKLLFK